MRKLAKAILAIISETKMTIEVVKKLPKLSTKELPG